MSVFDIDKNIKSVKLKDMIQPVSFSITSRKLSLAMFFTGEDINNMTFGYPTSNLYTLSNMFSLEITSDDIYVIPGENIISTIKDIILDIGADMGVQDVWVDDMLFKFDNRVNPTFVQAYEQFMIRNKFGAPGFEHPERVSYIHIILNKYTHWFYRIECIIGI